MKKILLMILILIPFVSCQKKTENIYDAVIVGGGLAGLSAAYHLKNELGENAKILLLEKEDRLGGRVWTKKFGKYFYELGATFAYTPKLVPKSFDLPELIIAPNSYGEYKNGKLTFSDSLNSKESFLTSGSNMLGNGKHYGKYEYLSHRAGGNGTMVEAYEKELAGKFILEAEVVSVRNEGRNNIVRYKKGGKEEEIIAKTVIVATTATVVAKIIKNMNEKSKKFVKSISYYSKIVINLLVRPDVPLDFASVYSDDMWLYVINNGNGVYSLYCYISNDAETTDYVEFAQRRLKETGILNEKSEILHIDSYFWKEEGTVISEKSYKNFSENALNPLPGVFLAGDYTWWNKYKIPYGMPPAYFSGKTAAKKVVEYLKK
ncbi:FAD-dependent oxidoreductase [bacterium]|nr:FAD-dependent oxidoreductase [bacterium]